MAHVGHTAAIMNIFLDIPFFLRGVCQSLYGKVGPKLTISSGKILDHIEDVNPLDPTSVVEEYLDDWWNYEEDWKTHPLEVDQPAAFKWHIQKVKENLYFVPTLTSRFAVRLP